MVASFLKQQAKYAFSALHPLLPSTARTRLKEHFELRYWRDYYRAIDDASDGDRGDTLAHERAHYRHFYTDFFELGANDYRDKRLLDIGCGPVGSLEWADMTRLRLGLDPLAHAYRGLDAQAQKMAYVAAASEAIPAATASFDIVASFNSLDHVADIGRTAGEIGRVTAPGGHFLLITEIDHLPTPTEPHRLTEAVCDFFETDFETRSRRLFGVRDDHNLYGSLFDRIAYRPGESGLLCAHFTRRASIRTADDASHR